MDSARMAAMSDPEQNFQFKRWRGPPKRISPRTMGVVRGPEFKDSSNAEDSYSLKLLQAAFRLDRLADQELAVGRAMAAERLSNAAQELREACR